MTARKLAKIINRYCWELRHARARAKIEETADTWRDPENLKLLRRDAQRIVKIFTQQED